MKYWKCPKCNKKTSQNKQFCKHCQFNVAFAFSNRKFNTVGTSGASQNRQWTREADRQKHGKDIIQPFMKDKPNKEFIKAYGDDKELLDNYYTKDELRKNE